MTYDYWEEKDGTWALAYTDDYETWYIAGYVTTEKEAELWYCKMTGINW